MAPKKVLIIGMDGFTWRLGRDFIDKGLMPTLAKLTSQGCHGDLTSVMPCETSPAWTSFQTGCLPDKTDVFCFHRYDRKKANISLNSFADIAVPSLWELADRAGRTVVSINMPVSFPSPKVKGVIIPGLLCPEVSEKTVHPPDAYKKYIEPLDDYRVVNADNTETLREYIDNQLNTEKTRCKAALEMMEDIDWDIFSFQMQSTDNLQHSHWWALDKDAHGFTQEAHEEVIRFYRGCDDILKELLDAAGPDVLTVLASDHGFCKEDHWLCINTWFKQHGYLDTIEQEPQPEVAEKSLKEELKERFPALKLLAQVYGRSAKLCKRIMRMITGTKKYPATPPSFKTELSSLRTSIDHANTKAFSLGALGLMIYIVGTEDERKELAAKITEEMLADLGPDSTKPLIEKITDGKDFYRDLWHIETLPDLVVHLKKGVSTVLNPTNEELVISKYHSTTHYRDKQRGTHEPEGIFVLHGPGVKSDTPLDADIIDVVPTLLAYMGLPVPKHIDGKVLTEAFDTLPQITYEDMDIDTKGKAKYSEAEQTEIEKQLGDLGYL